MAALKRCHSTWVPRLWPASCVAPQVAIFAGGAVYVAGFILLAYLASAILAVWLQLAADARWLADES